MAVLSGDSPEAERRGSLSSKRSPVGDSTDRSRVGFGDEGSGKDVGEVGGELFGVIGVGGFSLEVSLSLLLLLLLFVLFVLFSVFGVLML